MFWTDCLAKEEYGRRDKCSVAYFCSHHRVAKLCYDCTDTRDKWTLGVWHNEQRSPRFLLFDTHQLFCPARYTSSLVRNQLMFGAGADSKVLCGPILEAAFDESPVRVEDDDLADLRRARS